MDINDDDIFKHIQHVNHLKENKISTELGLNRIRAIRILEVRVTVFFTTKKH
jgi:hypothetical protein